MNDKQKWISIGCPLSMEAEILSIRDNIKKKHKHRGADLVLIKAAYNEMRNRQGRVDRELKCGSRCMNDLNKQLAIWLVIYDLRTPKQRSLCLKDLSIVNKSLIDADELIPLNDQIKDKINLLEYHDLVAEVVKVKGKKRYLELKKENNNKLIKKSILVQELL